MGELLTEDSTEVLTEMSRGVWCEQRGSPAHLGTPGRRKPRCAIPSQLLATLPTALPLHKHSMQKTAAHTLEEAVLRALLSGHKLTILGGGPSS